MIRTLTEKDHDNVMAFLSEERAFNLFIIGDIENFGYDTDFQHVWGEWVEGELNAVLLFYKGNYLLYAKGPFDVKGFADIILKDDRFQILSGKEEVVNQFDGLIPVGKRRGMYFAEVVEPTSLEKGVDRTEIRLATTEDVDSIFTLRRTIEEFTGSHASRESMVHTIETKSGRTYFMAEGDKAITSVSTTAENSMSAMVVGVCTATSHRKKGLASLCLSALCEDVLKEGKSLCLFYDNPAAGSIYKRLGFRDIGRWAMWHKAV